MWVAIGSLSSSERATMARQTSSGILRDVPRLSSMRILSRSGCMAATLSVAARAASAVAPETIGPATNRRAPSNAPFDCSLRI
jgi:hypothetical protein